MTDKYSKEVRILSPINIAIIKYWGKENEEKIIPLNNSVSLTLDPLNIHSASVIKLSNEIDESLIIFNKKKMMPSKRMIAMFNKALEMSSISNDMKKNLHFFLKSSNNFPTAAGMASSASGLSAFAFGLGKILDLATEDISKLARLGSGSASRSVIGGIVEWIKGNENTSCAIQLYDENYWPGLRVMICVVNEKMKKTSSTYGMQTSVETSQLLQYRIQKTVIDNSNKLKLALTTRNFQLFGEVAMRESNQLHAICMDTSPPLRYLSSESFAIIDFIETINKHFGRIIAAYTFDAGPNAFLLFEHSSEALIKHLLAFSFGLQFEAEEFNESDYDIEKLYDLLPKEMDSVEKVVLTKVGSGPLDCTHSPNKFAQYFEF